MGVKEIGCFSLPEISEYSFKSFSTKQWKSIFQSQTTILEGRRNLTQRAHKGLR